MKRSILIVVLTLFVAVSASAQRKVLVEEFTSSTCGPCASTDPIMEQFEGQFIDQVVVLKYHQDYPASGDIMYNAYPKGEDRGNAYGVHQQGIPWVEFNGMANTFPESVQALAAKVNETIDQSSVYYNLTVTQEVTADSIIAFVTVKAGATVDPEARLVVVIAEANVLHQASNGRIYHTSAARAALPEFNTQGEPTGSALTIPANGEATFRIGTKLRSVWNKSLLQLVAFVQNPTSKEVMGVETNKPLVSIERKGGTATVVGSNTTQARWGIKNAGLTPQNVKLSGALSKAAPYTLTIKTLDGTVLGDNALALAPGEEKEVLVSLATTGANTEKQSYAINLSTSENVGIIGAGGLAWPGTKKDLFVNAGLSNYTETSSGATKYQTAITGAGIAVSPISYTELLDGFENFSDFNNIFWASGYTVGIYTGGEDLSQSDTHKIGEFVRNGGNIAFSSMLMAATYNNAGLGDYVEQVFGTIATETAQGGWQQLVGVAGDVIGDGVDQEIDNIVATQALELSDLHPTSRAIFKNENEEIVGIRTEHQGGGKTVYLSFEPGNLTSTTGRKAVVQRIADWFNGTADVAPGKIADAGSVANYPNPFNSNTTISFDLQSRSNVSLVVRDMMGREVATLIDNKMVDAGPKTVMFDGSELANGNYLYVLTVDGKRSDGKMTIAK